MLTKKIFGKTSDGKNVFLFQLKNKNSMEVGIINYGAAVVSIKVPDKNGQIEDIALGYDSLENYIKGSNFFGAVCGRYANRISGAKFSIADSKYKLNANEGGNQLHGGINGFDKKFWDAEELISEDECAVRFSYESKDGEEGYPGNLDIEVTYSLTQKNEFVIKYKARTDKATHVNLTNHSYFNLSGHSSDSIISHKIKIISDKITENGAGNIPTGQYINVKSTPFDFKELKMIGEKIDEDNPVLNIASGYDQNWILRDYDGSVIKAVEVFEESSGRMLEMYTDQPGVQFYTGNFINGEIPGKGNVAYKKRSGFCLEAQHYPDSPNNKHFPSTLLVPGEKYKQTTIYRFSAASN